jgi:hypothetical protein
MNAEERVQIDQFGVSVASTEVSALAEHIGGSARASQELD